MKRLIVFFICVLSSLSAKPVVVFDYGGVFANTKTDSLQVFFTTHFHFPPAEANSIAQIIITKSLIEVKEYEIQFLKQEAERVGIILDENLENEYRKIRFQITEINPEMLAIVIKLKEMGYIVGMLSNTDQEVADRIRAFGHYNHFDLVLLSHEIGFTKLQQEAFQILLNKLQVEPDSCIFFDDKLPYVQVALSVGIDAMQFKSASEVAQALQERSIDVITP